VPEPLRSDFDTEVDTPLLGDRCRLNVVCGMPNVWGLSKLKRPFYISVFRAVLGSEFQVNFD
jgi:hypothetical protein